MTRRSPLLPLLCLMALSAPLAAQTAPTGGATTPAASDRWQITLDDERILWDVRILRLDGATLMYRQADSTMGAPVAQIRELRLIQKSDVQLGAGTTGGAISALMGADDEVYDLAGHDFADRLRTVQQVFLRHPPPAE